MAFFPFCFTGPNWFQKPSNSAALIDFQDREQSSSKNPYGSPNFAFIGGSLFRKKKAPQPKTGYYTKLLERYFWECDNLPDYRHTPEVEKILTEQKLIGRRENITREEIQANEKLSGDIDNNPFIKFFLRAQEIADEVNEMDLKENAVPYHREDAKLWKELPHVLGPDGRPMPRKAIKTDEEAHDKFWDFAKQFFFGLWGFRQRPYPPGRPIDMAQAVGYKKLENRYYDFIMKTGGWYYKDRLGRTRGPLELVTLKTAWAAGVIDTHTFIWGEDMDEWAPIGMVYGLEKAIVGWEIRLGAAAISFLHKLHHGMSPWVPLKGHEKKTYKQLQEEAIEGKRRDLAVLEANGGVWPGLRIPSHALFLWASGSELTENLQRDFGHQLMPNKFVPRGLRRQLIKAIPGLRPWEILHLEYAMDQIVYRGRWHREPLGYYTTGPPYISDWNDDILRVYKVFDILNVKVYNALQNRIPGFDLIMKKVEDDLAAGAAKQREKRNAKKKEQMSIFGPFKSIDDSYDVRKKVNRSTFWSGVRKFAAEFLFS